MSRIAIIGTGISGLGAAFLLHPRHDIVVYEKADYIGGHTRTRTVTYPVTREAPKRISVDTGFIVFNHRNYPNLTALFKYLDVPIQKSNMSFGVTSDEGQMEWGAEGFLAVFGQLSNLLNPRFYRFLIDVLRFNRGALRVVEANPGLSLGDLVRRMRLGGWFENYYILPMGGAIWSCSLKAMLAFPAKSFVDFFQRHGLLTIIHQPQWYSVTGGSAEYVRRLTESFKNKIRLNCGVSSVTRKNGKVQVKATDGVTTEYDHVIFAAHADEAIAMLEDASADEKEALRHFRYQKNTAVLHKDTKLMPKRRRCWASWIYHADSVELNRPIAVTYWMNHLQGIDKKYPVFVTLNPPRMIAEHDVFERHEFEHPVYTQDAVAAQARFPALQGVNNTWFCGAYLHDGFHEDGFKSAIDVAQKLGAHLPW